MYSLLPLVVDSSHAGFHIVAAAAITVVFVLFWVFDWEPGPNMAVVGVAVAVVLITGYISFKPQAPYANVPVQAKFIGWVAEVETLKSSKSYTTTHLTYGRFLVPEGEILIEVCAGCAVQPITKLYRN